MTLLEILDSLFLLPLQTFFEVIYYFAYKICGNLGVSIVVLSLAMNFLVLPLYRRADAMQEEERNIEAKLSKGVSHIKKTFHGDEQMLMLQTYYRQNNYKPTYVLRGATSLFLEIPFFIAAYRFLSKLSVLNGVSFGPIANLGAPDAMLVIGGLTINILPILMTIINFISSAIFTKDYPLKTKVQLYGMAVFFLIFLYNSPAGLVFYWTLNNLFSLVKTIFYKIKHPRKVLAWLSAAAGICILLYDVICCGNHSAVARILIALFGVALLFPIIYVTLHKKVQIKSKKLPSKSSNPKVFLSGAIFLSLLLGAVIPSSVISSSPQEFMILGYFNNPVWYIVSAFCLAFGTFVIWMGIFYWLIGEKYRELFDTAIWVLCFAALVDYMFFGKNLGTISSSLYFNIGELPITSVEKLENFVVLIVLAVGLVILKHFISKYCKDILAICDLAMCVMVAVNLVAIKSSIDKVDINTSAVTPEITLSKNGKNVIVLMLDRAMNEYMPYILNEKPELVEQLDGFVYYNNVLSFGGHTNIAAPALFGGYEYTPTEMNARANETLASKHDEALKVMPVIFDEAGYEVTVCDPPYAGYQEIGDLSIYDDYPDISAYNTIGAFNQDDNAQIVESNKKNFFRYAIMRCAPLCIQPHLYSRGMYCSLKTYGDGSYITPQEINSPLFAQGLSADYLANYNVLTHLKDFVTVSDNNTNTFLMLQNSVTHGNALLQEPDYIPSIVVDNRDYESKNHSRFTLNGQELVVETETQYAAYQETVSSMLVLGKWFDWMRAQNVYDNTRIIIVSDHGFPSQQLSSMFIDDTAYSTIDNDRLGDTEFYYPLLMVKDFNTTGFTVCDNFMTNADVPTLAVQDIIEDPINPFTGKEINNSEKTAHDQYVLASSYWTVQANNGNTFIAGKWYGVHDDVRDANNWYLIAENAVLSANP